MLRQILKEVERARDGAASAKLLNMHHLDLSLSNAPPRPK